jgi:hypothetical protein
MKLIKSLFLGSTAVLVASAGAQAADLPSRKAAPASYVKICDAYGAGFFYIPGTDTCVKIGGRVRADYAFTAKQTTFASGTIDGTTGARTNTVLTPANAQNTYGWEARGRVTLDARTPTAWGTVQTVMALRLARTNGVLENGNATGINNKTGAVLEAAYIRFAGFTFGAARDNFVSPPGNAYANGLWSSFGNGAKQLAYTATFGGGLSATVAIQDSTDTTFGAGAVSYFAPTVTHAYNNLPQLNGRIDLEQSWGSASVAGVVGKAVGVNSTAAFDVDKTVYALGAGVKINLPMLAAGDALWLNAGYADGMTEYTTQWGSYRGADVARNIGGFVSNAPSFLFSTNGVNPTIETVKSWNLAAAFEHYWTPSIRHSIFASYGAIEGTASSKARVYVGGTNGLAVNSGFGDAKMWTASTQIAWLPVKNFEIGVEALYSRHEQDVRRTVVNPGAVAAGATAVTREKQGNWTGRMRAERTF